MNSLKPATRITTTVAAIIACITTFHSIAAAPLGPKVDDFNDPKKNSLGIDRQFFDDSSMGGKSKATSAFKKGVLNVKGQLIPLRGQPAWASTVLLLDPQGRPQDLTRYTGIRLMVRVNKGNLSLSANSSEVTNFDYHASPVTHKRDGKFHEIKIPFNKMKRAWSAQTKLNTKTIASLSLVAFDIQKGSFDFEFDEVSFY